MQLFRKRVLLSGSQKKPRKMSFSSSLLWLVFGILLGTTGFAAWITQTTGVTPVTKTSELTGLKPPVLRMSISEKHDALPSILEVQRESAGRAENSGNLVIEKLELDQQLNSNRSRLRIEYLRTHDSPE